MVSSLASAWRTGICSMALRSLLVSCLSGSALAAVRYLDEQPRAAQLVCFNKPVPVALGHGGPQTKVLPLCVENAAPSPFSDPKKWFLRDNDLTDGYWQDRNVTLSLESIRRGMKGQKGQEGARLRWRRVAEKLLRGEEEVKVAVMGGSMTCGAGSKAPWSERFQTLMRELGFRKITVKNHCKSGTTSNWLLSNFQRFEKNYVDADIILVDYSINDNFYMKSVDSGKEQPGGPTSSTSRATHPKGGLLPSRRSWKRLLHKLIYKLPQRPAIVDLETYAPDCSSTNGGAHWEALGELDVPTVNSAKAVCDAWGETHWNTGQSLELFAPHGAIHTGSRISPYAHPNIITHDLIGRVMVGAFVLEMDHVCKHGVSGHDFSAANSHASETTEEKCLSTPLTDLDADHGEAGFGALHKDGLVWRFYEDSPGKPGWIAAGKGVPGDIMFQVDVRGGYIMAEFLGTYENVGSAVCWIGDANNPQPGNECRFDGLISDHVSQPKFVTMRTSVIGGTSILKCRSDGKKFKLISLTSC